MTFIPFHIKIKGDFVTFIPFHIKIVMQVAKLALPCTFQCCGKV